MKPQSVAAKCPREGVKYLDQNDIQSVLEALPGRVPDADAARLTKHVNSCLRYYKNRYSQPPQWRAPHQRIRQLRKPRSAVDRAIKTLEQEDGWLGAAVRREIRSAADRGRTVPIQNLGEVTQAMRHLSHVLQQCEIKQRQREDPGSGHRAPDLSRYHFVVELAGIYREDIGLSPDGSREGPWCTFLAEILTKCELRPLGNAGAQRLWLEARAVAEARGWMHLLDEGPWWSKSGGSRAACLSRQ